MSEDPKLSERYRGLPREEPPRSLDDAILAASRRSVHGRRRWYGPLAAAAVITLAIGVTLHVQHDRPSEEVDAVSPSMTVQETPPAEAPKAAAPRRADEMMRQPERRAPQPFAGAPSSADSAGELARAPAPATAPPEPAAKAEQGNDVGSASAGARAQRDEQRSAPESAAAQRAPSPQAAPVPRPVPAPAAKPAPDRSGRGAARLMQREKAPEPELERIAELRRLGRHEDADKALAEFRKTYPDYKISGAMLERVERR